jgi:hypothetical protein
MQLKPTDRIAHKEWGLKRAQPVRRDCGEGQTNVPCLPVGGRNSVFKVIIGWSQRSQTTLGTWSGTPRLKGA